MCAWLLSIALPDGVCVGVCVCACICVPTGVLMTGGVIWTLYDWLNNLYNFCIAAVVSIVSRCGFSIDAHSRNQSNKSKLVLTQ